MINLSGTFGTATTHTRVRRGAMQAIVREAYQQMLAEQDSGHRAPGE
ncbi:hypothetical protein [Streptosporangium sp. NPDC000396]